MSGAHWNVEIGGITEVNNLERNPSALLFEDIPDCETGRVLSCATSSVTTLAAALRLEAIDKRSLVMQVGSGRRHRADKDQRLDRRTGRGCRIASTCPEQSPRH